MPHGCRRGPGRARFADRRCHAPASVGHASPRESQPRDRRHGTATRRALATGWRPPSSCGGRSGPCASPAARSGCWVTNRGPTRRSGRHRRADVGSHRGGISAGASGRAPRRGSGARRDHRRLRLNGCGPRAHRPLRRRSRSADALRRRRSAIVCGGRSRLVLRLPRDGGRRVHGGGSPWSGDEGALDGTGVESLRSGSVLRWYGGLAWGCLEHGGPDDRSAR